MVLTSIYTCYYCTAFLLQGKKEKVSRFKKFKWNLGKLLIKRTKGVDLVKRSHNCCFLFNMLKGIRKKTARG